MRYVAGKEGGIIAVIAMVAMASLSFFFTPTGLFSGEAGICAPSPNLWHLSHGLSWLLNNVLIFGIAVLLVFANKKLVFVPGQDYVFPTLFLITTAANPWLTVALNSSTLLCAANLGVLYLLMNAYGRANATQEMFVMATIAALGGMIQYAFLLFVPVHLICAGTLQLVRPKELCAYLLGLIAPYWTFIGLGIVSPHDFALPHIESMFTFSGFGLDLLFILLEVVPAIIATLVCVARNSLTIYTTSVRLMLFNRVICIFGLAALIFACLDFSNFIAYIETIFLVAAIQGANAFVSTEWKYSSLLLLSIALLYIIFFTCILTS